MLTSNMKHFLNECVFNKGVNVFVKKAHVHMLLFFVLCTSQEIHHTLPDLPLIFVCPRNTVDFSTFV